MKKVKFFLSLFLFLSVLSISAQKRITITGTVYLDLSQSSISGKFIDIPVTFVSPDTIKSLDIALEYNESFLQYDTLSYKAPYVTDILGNYTPTAKKLIVTSNSFQRYPTNQTIFTIRFEMIANSVSKSDLSPIAAYLNGRPVALELKGNFPFRSCSLILWSDNSPIRYDSINPTSYLITNIFGGNATCVTTSNPPVQPDLNGNFIFNSFNAPNLKINRDILPTTLVQPVVNGLDINQAIRVLMNDPSFTPNIYQLIALDVNADGVVSAGDLSQLNLRTLNKISEFKQKWNYNNLGISNGSPSKDWLFVDSVSLATPAYKISTTFPLNDGIGFSKAKVPVVPFCLPAPAADASITGRTYTGILVGDSNGNYTSIVNDGKLKRIALVAKDK